MNSNIYIDEANENLKEHKYVLLAKGLESEIWRCGKPGSSFYAFNIAIMPMGISIVGDIGELSFNVYGRDMSFLAGKDIEYYIHSKLSPNSKEVEYDKEHISEIILSTIKYDLENNEIFWEYFKENELIELQQDVKNLNLIELNSYFNNLAETLEFSDKRLEILDNISDFLKKAVVLDNELEAYQLIDNCDTFSFDETMEYSFNKPSGSLISKLYMINKAAKEIISIKDN